MVVVSGEVNFDPIRMSLQAAVAPAALWCLLRKVPTAAMGHLRRVREDVK